MCVVDGRWERGRGLIVITAMPVRGPVVAGTGRFMIAGTGRVQGGTGRARSARAGLQAGYRQGQECGGRVNSQPGALFTLAPHRE